MFLVGIFIMLGIGFVRNAASGFPVHEPVMVANEGAGLGAIGALVLLRAFASGCAALTGVEAISDGVPAFRKPESVNARKTLGIMITILAITFSGITFLAHQYGTIPLDQAEPNYQTVVSQIARQVFGGTNAAYYYIQFATMAILVLAANTSYSDFPRLAYFLARDSYIPKQYTYRGDRLAYTTGIVTLGLMASLVLAIFGGETERLIPLYALGVFLSFTISQASMCVRWVRMKEPGWHMGLAVNAVGAVATGIVAIIVVVTKFSHGAWIICIVIPMLILLMRGIHKHYERSAAELAVSTPLDPHDIHHTVIVPVSQLNRVARQTLAYARSISDNVTAVHVSDNSEELDEFQRKWEQIGTDIPLILIESPYRALIGPLDELSGRGREATAGRHHHRRPAGIRRAPSLGAHPAQPDRPAPQSRAPLPPRHRRDQRALPPRQRRGAGRGVARIAGGVDGVRPHRFVAALCGCSWGRTMVALSYRPEPGQDQCP